MFQYTAPFGLVTASAADAAPWGVLDLRKPTSGFGLRISCEPGSLSVSIPGATAVDEKHKRTQPFRLRGR